MNDFLNNLFLSTQSWIVVYVVQAFFWFFVASWKNEKAKYVGWAFLLITTVIFVAGIFVPEVRRFFYLLSRR